jgi:hypothetical protein
MEESGEPERLPIGLTIEIKKGMAYPDSQMIKAFFNHYFLVNHFIAFGDVLHKSHKLTLLRISYGRSV